MLSGRGVPYLGLGLLAVPALDCTAQGSSVTADNVLKVLVSFGDQVTTVTWAGNLLTATTTFAWAQQSSSVPAAIGIAFNPTAGQVEMRRNSNSGAIQVLVTALP